MAHLRDWCIPTLIPKTLNALINTGVPPTNGNIASVVTPDASPPASAARTSSFPGRAFRRGGPAQTGQPVGGRAEAPAWQGLGNSSAAGLRRQVNQWDAGLKLLPGRE